MRRLCVICARGGSKGIENKNLRPMLGKPLIAHSIERARESGVFDAVAVSSDSAEILQAAGAAGADHLVERPVELASDTAPKVPAIRHCARAVEEATGAPFDTVVDLDATSPLRTADDIRGVVGMLEEGSAGNVVSGAPARRSPYFNLVELDAAGRVRVSKPLETPVGRRQDAPPCFDLNASIYAWRRRALLDGHDSALADDTALYEMPAERSFDIDSELDWQIVEFLLARGGAAP